MNIKISLERKLCKNKHFIGYRYYVVFGVEWRCDGICAVAAKKWLLKLYVRAQCKRRFIRCPGRNARCVRKAARPPLAELALSPGWFPDAHAPHGDNQSTHCPSASVDAWNIVCTLLWKKPNLMIRSACPLLRHIPPWTLWWHHILQCNIIM